eukprot:1181555-Prorocentrum_minimum.AAC.2
MAVAGPPTLALEANSTSRRSSLSSFHAPSMTARCTQYNTKRKPNSGAKASALMRIHVQPQYRLNKYILTNK